MDTLTVTITTAGILILAAASYRMLLNSAKPDPQADRDDERISITNTSEFTNGDAIGVWSHNHGLSDAVTRPIETDEVDRNYHPNRLDEYASPVLDEAVTVEAYKNFLAKVGPVKTGIGTILARDKDSDEWWPIRYRPGHDALGFVKLWLYLDNGPGGKFCWHISANHRPKAHPISITSWGTIATFDEIKEVATREAA